jgi:hypothetical protein
MIAWKRIFSLLLISLIGVGGLEVGERLVFPHHHYGLIPTAEAVVGRPLTPVSVAGVARRTSRRCSAGVYDC